MDNKTIKEEKERLEEGRLLRVCHFPTEEELKTFKETFSLSETDMRVIRRAYAYANYEGHNP